MLNVLIYVNLVRSVTYHRDGLAITVPEDTMVQFDPEGQFAFWEGDRFDLFRDEYCLTN